MNFLAWIFLVRGFYRQSSIIPCVLGNPNLLKCWQSVQKFKFLYSFIPFSSFMPCHDVAFKKMLLFLKKNIMLQKYFLFSSLLQNFKVLWVPFFSDEKSCVSLIIYLVDMFFFVNIKFNQKANIIWNVYYRAQTNKREFQIHFCACLKPEQFTIYKGRWL